MKTVLSLYIALATSAAALAQTVSVPVVFKDILPGNTKQFVYTFAANPLATDSTDADLGEKEIPNIPPPGGVFLVYTYFLDTVENEEIWFDRKDIRNMRQEKYSQDYPVRIARDGLLLSMVVNEPLPPGVDSIYILDDYIDPPGSIYSAKLVPGVTVTDSNSSHYNFRVRVWYDGTSVGVHEETHASALQVMPVPANDVLHIRNIAAGVQAFQVVDVSGRILAEYECEGAETMGLSVASLPRGVYTIVERTIGRAPQRAYFIRQ